MKKILTLLISCATALSVFAQYNNASTVTITVNGNRSRQILVDGKSYSNNSNTNNTTMFNTRPGYDMQITVNNDGSVQLNEIRKRRNQNAYNQNQYKSPMPD